MSTRTQIHLHLACLARGHCRHLAFHLAGILRAITQGAHWLYWPVVGFMVVIDIITVVIILS
jgi:hypothetical protein